MDGVVLFAGFVAFGSLMNSAHAALMSVIYCAAQWTVAAERPAR